MLASAMQMLASAIPMIILDMRMAVRGAKREADYWVPADAYAVADDFRHQHVPHVPLEVFAELLIKLNRVWKARESRQLERQK